MQQAQVRIDAVLLEAIQRAEGHGTPPGLIAAVRHAVFPGGARIRPLLCLSVAAACGDPDRRASEAAAAAIELIHCASLVHDDLPCFDNAELRRGLPSVHALFGERLAVLAGDALIVLAFETLAVGLMQNQSRLPAILRVLARRTGLPDGIVAGQAWECESWVALPDYHRAKTGSLFAAATEMGALAAGAEPQTWRAFGERLGEAYQVADDIRDAACDTAHLGKPSNRDRALGRPSAVSELGLPGALEYFEHLIEHARCCVPECAGARALRSLLTAESERLLPPRVRALAVA